VRALLERLHGLALVQGREPRKAHGHFERALEVARSLGAEFEVALTLKAMADVGAPDADTLRAESEEILKGLGVVSVPRVPLP